MTQKEIDQLAAAIVEKIAPFTKELLTVDEAAKYMGIKVSYLYKLTMHGEIPHYKPNGKMCYFKRTELDEWLQRNPVATAGEIAERANSYCMRNRSNI